MAGKPNYRVVAKSKASGKFQDIAAFWIGDKGISGQLDRAVDKIVLTNGAVIKPDACWFNLQENKDEASADRQDNMRYPDAQKPAPIEDSEGDGIPF